MYQATEFDRSDCRYLGYAWCPINVCSGAVDDGPNGTYRGAALAGECGLELNKRTVTSQFMEEKKWQLASLPKGS